MTNPQPPQVLNPVSLTMADVERIVAAQLAAVEARHADEMRALQDQLNAQVAAMQVRGVVALIPAHSAGPGLDVAATWSQHEQEISRSGLGMTVAEYLKTLEGVDSAGNILGRFQALEQQVAEVKSLLTTVAASAHAHQ